MCDSIKTSPLDGLKRIQIRRRRREVETFDELESPDLRTVLKRRMLMQRGWPASALLITVVRDELGEGHAVLTVRTTSGDLVMDNRLDDVVTWHALPYDFIKRQSSVNPMAWVALTPSNDGTFSQLGTTTTQGSN